MEEMPPVSDTCVNRSLSKLKHLPLAVAAVFSFVAAGCKDEQRQQVADEGQNVGIPLQAAEPVEPEMQDVRLNLLPLLTDFPMVKLGDVQISCTRREDGGVLVTARAMLSVEENLYDMEDAPVVFNAERKEINEAMNRAMLPESSYLLQVGADASWITEEDRVAKPLPEHLQKMADEIKQMALRPIYRLRTPAQMVVEIPASLVATRAEGRWVMKDISFDTQPLRSLLPLIPERALPKDAAVVTDGFEAKYRALLREKIDAFNTAAKPYIESRESAARTRMLEAQARCDETEKKEQQEAAALEVSRKEWESLCAKFFYDSATYRGEWKREKNFGKFTLRISRAEKFDRSLQFVGTLSDTDLPQAELRVVGRCEVAEKREEPVSCVVRVYNGRYDPDVATAEVFDKKDGLLQLSLGDDGSLAGILTCESWAEQPQKNFQVQLNLVPSKAGGRRPSRHRAAATPPRSSQPSTSSQQPAR